MKKNSLLTAALLMLGGCGSWHNPNIADPAKEKEIFKRDREFCENQNRQNVPVGAQTDDAPRNRPLMKPSFPKTTPMKQHLKNV